MAARGRRRPEKMPAIVDLVHPTVDVELQRTQKSSRVRLKGKSRVIPYQILVIVVVDGGGGKRDENNGTAFGGSL